jgi:hypothetical protein
VAHPVTPTSTTPAAAIAPPVRRAGLARSVLDANAAQPDLRLYLGPPPGDWIRCTDLLADLAGWAGRIAEWLTFEYGEAPDRVVAGYLLSWYLTVPAKVGALLFHIARRVPDLGPADLAVRFGEVPQPVAVALLSERFACRADDPGATLAEATPVPDDVTLAALLRERYAAHTAGFLTELTAAVRGLRLGRHTLWASATDALDGACWRVGQALGAERAGVADAALVLPAVTPPFTSASTLRPDSVGGWTRRRDSCCFHYVLRTGMGTCATCPRVCER